MRMNRVALCLPIEVRKLVDELEAEGLPIRS